MTETVYPSHPGPADVAIIIPAFNAGRFLDQALASVAGQTVEPGVVVVADDCSTDDTRERARRWRGRLPLELVQLERNGGPGVARNHAIQATGAALLAMLDSDDLFLPDHLETMIATHAAAPGLVSAQELSWYPALGLTVPSQQDRPSRASYQLGALLRHNFVNFGFFSRDLYDLAGGFRDEYCEDWGLWIRMLRAGAKVTMASHATAIHRVRADSRSFDSARTAERGITVLTAQLRAAKTPAEAAAARAGLRTLRGKLSFYQATQLAAQGRFRQARRAALGGLPGGGARAAAGLLALSAAPSAATRLEQLTRPYRSSLGRHAPEHASSPASAEPAEDSGGPA